MSFDRPLALLSLVVLAARWRRLSPRCAAAAAYAVRFTNVDVLRGVAPPHLPLRERASAALVLVVLGLLVRRRCADPT